MGYSPSLGRFMQRDPLGSLQTVLASDPATQDAVERARLRITELFGESRAAGVWLYEYVDGANTYLYVSGNPITLTDPSGLSRNGMADRQSKPTGPRFVGTGVFYCEHKGFKSSGKASHAYVLVGGRGYGYYAESHRGRNAGIKDDVAALFRTAGSVADDDHLVPVGTTGPRSECFEIMVNPCECDPDKFRAGVENWVKAQRAAYPGKGGATSTYSAVAYSCYSFVFDAIQMGELNGCKNRKNSGVQQIKY